ncbi:hypothetical protein B0I35DRAFT_56122 [Stachybotrys elegans]|uniref:U-box domain-containing protein n=1 Tax=Stachybotrys elegans TaxID=80388 RepID=A0A8K0SM95_9HYPO|nr:hypothetical protein B0I35DRAFT_56122 [Stachybotrys elegans]
MAAQLKEQGNVLFRNGDYAGADSFYSKAIVLEPKNPALYTNRAMARLKLRQWEAVIADCHNCLVLAPDNMKARYYLAQAQLEIKDFDEAVANALVAHRICADTNDKNLKPVTELVLRCKKDRWDEREKHRVREDQGLERELAALLAMDRDQAVGDVDSELERKTIHEEYDAKLKRLAHVFERARAADQKERKVPQWAIDDISFGFMVDPVVTKNGKSYERSSLIDHLRRNQTDPLTREHMTPADVRPNLALKEACNEFLETNGWAADW